MTIRLGAAARLLLTTSALALGANAFAWDKDGEYQIAQAGPVMQSAPASAAPVDEQVVVTGVRGRERSVQTTPVPVDSISADALESSGALGGEVGQALQNLVPSFNMPRQSSSGPADFIKPAQLRGMSPDQVLVLVNGKRRHTSSVVQQDAKTGKGTTPVDFNSLPLSAIKRIEVLRDGAGAQYGSDAIAGVINVILDDTPDGVEVNASYGAHVTNFKATNLDLDITDGETLNVSVEGAMPFANKGGFVRFGVEYKDRAETNRAGLDLVPFFEDFGNVALVGGQRNYKPGDAATEDMNVWFNSEVKLDGGLELYAFGTYNQRDAEGTGFFRYPIGSAGLANNVPAIVPNPVPLGYRPVTTGDNQDLQLALGLRGDAGAWAWDVSANYGDNATDIGVKDSLNPSLGAASPRKFHSAGFNNELFTLNADATRNISLGDFAQAGSLAVGAEYRYQSFETTPGDPASYAAGPLAGPPNFRAIGAQAGGGLKPADARSASRDTFSAYAEVTADVRDNLFLDAAVRYENASDFGDSIAGKLSGRWEFAPGAALRAAVSNSYRAPSLSQGNFQFSTTNFGAGGILTTVNLLPVDHPIAVALGAKPLDAETSFNLSGGLTVKTDIGLSFTADLFQIDVDDRITLSERIDCQNPPVPAPTQALCAGANIQAVNFFTNAVDTRTRGVDVVANYKTGLFNGDLNLSAAFNYAKTTIRGVNAAAVAGVEVLGVEERNTLTEAAPKTKVILTADWRDSDFNALVRATNYGSATRVFNFGGGFEPEQTYGGEWQLDLEAGYQITPNIGIYAGASNVLDEYPDLSDSLINYFDNLPYDVLSPIGMNGRYIYAGTKVTF
jgi:iron complex outermembrane receptor protein